MRLYCYILRVSGDPDNITCFVPFKVNEKLIFFGPCKKRLRKNLCDEFSIIKQGNFNVSDKKIYVMGLNGYNNKGKRKIVWFGKIKEIFTFEHAYKRYFKKKEFQFLVNHNCSPLHVEPMYTNNDFQGYKLISKMHDKNNEWIEDIAGKNNNGITINSKCFHLKDGYSRDILRRDCCFICENIFFAEGKGIDIGNDLLHLFREVQDIEIDNYAVFGRDIKNNAIGKCGSYLQIDDDSIINEFITLLEKKSKSTLKSKSYLDHSEKNHSC